MISDDQYLGTLRDNPKAGTYLETSPHTKFDIGGDQVQKGVDFGHFAAWKDEEVRRRHLG